MSGIYGADRWTRAYGDVPALPWFSGLGGVTLSGIARGIERCERDDSGRLPTLGQFHALCRDYASAGSYSGSPPVPQFPPGGVSGFLDRAESHGGTEVGRVHLDMCRRIRSGEGLSDEERASLPVLRGEMRT